VRDVMLPEIQLLLKKECRLNSDQPVLVGLSGGPDSLCLMELLHQAGYSLVAAHFDHQLRPESQKEAETLAPMLAERQIPLVSGQGDVRAFAQAEGLSVEEAARKLRYGFLFSQASAQGAQAVAVGHNADDQIETVLMHLLRGAGLNGLKGMQVLTYLPDFDARIPLVRPLLGFWRAEIERFCQLNDLRPLQDASNQSREFLRNRIRLDLLPQLEAYNPRIRAALWRSARILGDDYAILEGVLRDAWRICLISEEPDQITFALEDLLTYPPEQQRHLIRRALERLAPETVDVRYDLLERAVAFLGSQREGRRDLSGGLHLVREGHLVFILRADAEPFRRDCPQLAGPGMSVPVPGQVDLADGWRLRCDLLASESLDMNLALHCEDPFQAWLDAGDLPAELHLRTRRAGDRFQPLGMAGRSMKLSDFFINEKLPQSVRANWPLLCAGKDILWIPGFRPAHRFRLTSETRQALALSLTVEGADK
jgi:tRNA(Ile)-lysidine synthase